MKILHLLTSGQSGGIESLCRDIGIYSDFDNTFCFVSGGGIIYEQMKKLDLAVIDISNKGSKFSLQKFKMIRKLATQYDIVVVHHGDPYLKLYFSMLKGKTNEKLVSIIHSCFTPATSNHFQRIKRFIYEKIVNISLEKSDAIIYVAKAGKLSFEKKFGRKKAKSYIVYNGIAPEKIIDGKNNIYKKELPYNITYIGRLNIIKGVDNLLKAAYILKNKYDIRVSIVGNGPDRGKFEKLADELKIDDIVTFYGQKTNVEEYLKKASVFVYPSICPEVFGISIVEAMAYGIPCVSNNVGGIPEVISDKISGLLCDSFDPEELAYNIELILNSDNTQMINEGRKVAEKFSIINTVKKLQNVFVEVCEGR